MELSPRFSWYRTQDSDNAIYRIFPYEKQKAEELNGERAERVIETMKLFGIDAGRMAEYSVDVLSEVFGFGGMEYFTNKAV